MNKNFFKQLKPFLAAFIFVIILAFLARSIIFKYHPEWMRDNTEVEKELNKEITEEDIIKSLDIIFRIWNLSRQSENDQTEQEEQEEMIYDQ